MTFLGWSEGRNWRPRCRPCSQRSHRGHTEKLWWGPKFVLEGGATSTVCITAENFRFSACTRPPPGAGPRGLLAGCAGAKLGWSRHFFVEAEAAQNRGRGTRPRAARRPHGCDAVRKSGKDTRSTKRKEKQPRRANMQSRSPTKRHVEVRGTPSHGDFQRRGRRALAQQRPVSALTGAPMNNCLCRRSFLQGSNMLAFTVRAL